MNISKIARKSIEDEFNYKDSIDIKKLIKDNPSLKENGASFVTLIKNGKLRGCIGSLEAKRPLIEDIIANAKSAAFKDPRFSKLTHEELHIIDIEVSVLTKPKLLEYTDLKDLKIKIRPNIDGVILKLNSNQATFLPQVWEELPEFESFFENLLNKANLPIDSFKKLPKIFTYQVKKFK